MTAWNECLKSECLKIEMSESWNAWKSECPKVWMSESLDAWKFEWLWMSESLNMSERPKVWMSESLRIWLSENLDVSKFGCLNVWMSEKSRFLNCRNLKDVSHESFVFTSSTVGIRRMSRTKASFSHLQLLEFEGCLARRFVFKPSTAVGMWGMSGTKASFSNLQLQLECEGCLARKLRSHIFNCRNLKGVSHESFVFTSSTVGMWGMSRTKASFSNLQLQLECEGCLARKLRFQTFNCSWNARDVSHESFVLTSSTVGIWRVSRTKASFSHLQLLDFEGCLARKLRSHIFNCWNLKDVWHESFVFKPSTAFGMWGMSRTKASFSHLQLSEFEGCLAWNAFLRDRFPKCCVLQDKTCLGWGEGKLVWRNGSQTVPAVRGSWSDQPRSGTDNSGIVLLTFLRVVLSGFATQSLKIAVASFWRRSCA